MQTYQKNINLLIVKIPCAVAIVLMLCALALVANSHYTELTSNFNSQCKQYDTSVNLFLSTLHSKAAPVTQNTQITDNLKTENYSLIQEALVTIRTSSYGQISHVYIVNKNNEVFRLPSYIDASQLISYEDIAKYGEITLLYSKNATFSDELFSLIYPLHDSGGRLSGGLVLTFNTELLLKSIPYNTENPPMIIIEGPVPSYNSIKNRLLHFLYIDENRISVPGNGVDIVLKTSIMPIVKTVVFLFLLFILALTIFILLLKYLAYCVNQSINQPIDEMQETIQSYTSSATQTERPVNEDDE